VQPASVLCANPRRWPGLLDRAHLDTVWPVALYPPTTALSFLLPLLVRYQLLFPLPEPHHHLLLAPCMLPATQPSVFALPHATAGRFFHFEQPLPVHFFPELLVRFLVADQSDWRLMHYWRAGLLLENRARCKALLRVLDDCAPPHRHQVHLTVYAPSSARASTSTSTSTSTSIGQPLALLLDDLNTLLCELLALTFATFVPWFDAPPPHSHSEPLLFSQRQCQSAVANGRGHLLAVEAVTSAFSGTAAADGDLRVPLERLVPDLSMGAVRGCKIRWSDIRLQEPAIGEGAFASVYVGTWRGELVAVKRLNLGDEPLDFTAEELADISAEEREYIDYQREQVLHVFEEFQREAALISALQHPNVVDLKGVVMEPFALVLEYMREGTLGEYILDLSKPFDVSIFWNLARDIANAMVWEQ
jgi:Protein tyrosine and serine/threonine kinase/C-terminal of Roc, COR, domain